jgi:hypothetical protein
LYSFHLFCWSLSHFFFSGQYPRNVSSPTLVNNKLNKMLIVTNPEVWSTLCPHIFFETQQFFWLGPICPTFCLQVAISRALASFLRYPYLDQS